MLIIGAKGHAKELIDILQDDFNILKNLYFFDNISIKTENGFYGFPVLNDYNRVKNLFKIDQRFSLGIGSPKIRYELTRKFISLGGVPYSVISNRALIAKQVKLGKGVNMMPYSSVFNNSEIGDGVLVNSYASVHHDCQIGNFTELSPGCRILGSAKIGALCLIGANSVVLPDLAICDNVVIGAGAVITKSIFHPGTYVGIPAKKIK